MSTREPIKFEDIRAGDTIEREWLGTVLRIPVARVTNSLVYTTAEFCTGNLVDSTWFLIDRPTPAVELPSSPTLGWIEQDFLSLEGTRKFGRFAAGENEREHERPALDEFGAGSPVKKINQHYRVTAFIPATAVPTEALDALRKIHLAREGCAEIKCSSHYDVDRFLAAIDEATA